MRKVETTLSPPRTETRKGGAEDSVTVARRKEKEMTRTLGHRDPEDRRGWGSDERDRGEVPATKSQEIKLFNAITDFYPVCDV